jgi:hypothetical protein
MNMKRNNGPEGIAKHERDSQNAQSSPPSVDQPKVNEDIEKFNNEIAQLTEKNNELLVRYWYCIKTQSLNLI